MSQESVSITKTTAGRLYSELLHNGMWHLHHFKQKWGLEEQASSAETFCSDCHSVSVTLRQDMAWALAGPRRLRAPALATESWFCVKGCANLCLQTLKKAHFHLCMWMMAGVLWEPPWFREHLERQLASFTSRTVLLLCCFSYRYEVLDPFRNILFFLKTNVLISASEVWGKEPNRNAISVVCLWL